MVPEVQHELVPDNCPGIIVSYWDDWGDTWATRGLTEADLEWVREQYPWIDLEAGLHTPLLLTLADVMVKAEEDLREKHGLERKVRLSPGCMGIRGLSDPAGHLFFDKTWEAMQRIYDHGGEIPNYRAFTGYHWNWDQNALTDRPGRLFKYGEPAPNSTHNGYYYGMLESIGQGFVLRNYLDGYHRPLTFSSGGGGDWAEGDRTPPESHHLRNLYGRYYEKQLGPRNSLDIFKDNSWPYGEGPVYNISGGWWLETLLARGYLQSFEKQLPEEQAREKAIQTCLNILKEGFRASWYGTEDTPFRKPFAMWDHFGKWSLSMMVADRLPRRLYSDYWEIYRRIWVWALSGGDGGREFVDDKGKPAVFFLTKRQMLEYWKRGKRDFEAVRDYRLQGMALRCEQVVPLDGETLDLSSADLRGGAWVNFEQERATYAFDMTVSVSGGKQAALRLQIGGTEFSLSTLWEGLLEGEKQQVCFERTFPVDVDGDGKPEVWARGNFLRLQAVSGDITVHQFCIRQKTRVLRHGLLGDWVMQGGHPGGLNGEPFEQPGECYVNESNAYRMYARIPLQALSGQKVEKARLGFLLSRFMYKDDYRYIGKMPTVTAWTAGDKKLDEMPEALGDALDSVRIEAMGLWYYLDVTQAACDALLAGRERLDIVCTFHAPGDSRCHPLWKTNLGIYNSETRHESRRPRLLVDVSG